MILTDWRKPGYRVLARLSDPRVEQLWDSQHLVAKQLAKEAHAPQPEPQCCTKNGFFWDLVAFYPPYVLWTDGLPPAILFDGPVVDQEEKIQGMLNAPNPPPFLPPRQK